jgi:putative DNA primase/helicase
MLNMRTTTKGEFHKELLPDAVSYFEQHGLPLVGKGKQRQGPCPIHGGSDSLSVNVETGCWFCFSCGEKGGDMLDFHRKVHALGFVEAARELGAWMDKEGERGSRSDAPTRHAVAVTNQRTKFCQPLSAPPLPKEQAAARIVAEANYLAGTTGSAYLSARGCVLPPEDGDLRFHPSLRHQSGHVGPALVAQITDAITSEPMGIHRTWVTPTGKADVPKPKMVLGSKQGGVIRLWPDEAVTTGLAIAEGIETALTIAHDYKPVWSLIDAGNLAAFPVLAGIETLVIGADNDAAGLKGAHACADRWAAAGVDVRIVVPQVAGSDWNDAEAAR